MYLTRIIKYIINDVIIIIIFKNVYFQKLILKYLTKCLSIMYNFYYTYFSFGLWCVIIIIVTRCVCPTVRVICPRHAYMSPVGCVLPTWLYIVTTVMQFRVLQRSENMIIFCRKVRKKKNGKYKFYFKTRQIRRSLYSYV